MPTVHFTANLKRHVDCPPQTVPAGTLKTVLEAVFSGRSQLRGYVLDDQGRLRKHVVVFIDNDACTDREQLSDPVGEASEVWVMQALSGG